jgi:hypothetical protein
VSFDFQSGVKTTVFTDGSKVQQRFDPASMKGLADAHPFPKSPLDVKLPPASAEAQQASTLKPQSQCKPVPRMVDLARLL